VNFRSSFFLLEYRVVYILRQEPKHDKITAMAKTPFFIKIRSDLMDRLRKVSKERGVTIISIIESALDQYFSARSDLDADAGS